ncbi:MULTISPECIES: hypothetical protein [unclassified Streptomyces]|uniref:hypothetical protein n=1 Tax=unclassified Streptomyces TaxID=2593676 RepID=UPI0032522282
MRSRRQSVHDRDQHVIVEHNRMLEIFVKYLVLVGLLYLAARILYWGAWIPFAGAGLYLLWELSRLNSAFGELAGRWNEQNRQRQESDRDAYDLERSQQQDAD